MKKRILITGPSGIGKTTLAEVLSKKYSLPFIGVSMKTDIAEQHNPSLNTHQAIIDFMEKHPAEGFDMQWKLLMKRQILFGEYYTNGFVTDRGHIDSLVYTWIQVIKKMENWPEEKKLLLWNKIQKKATSVHRLFTHIIYLPWVNNWKLEDNGIRVYDPNFQRESGLIYSKVVKDLMRLTLEELKVGMVYEGDGTLPYILMLEENNREERIKFCINFIENYG